jgi:DNA-directed RNA polymerase beta subunit
MNYQNPFHVFFSIVISGSSIVNGMFDSIFFHTKETSRYETKFSQRKIDHIIGSQFHLLEAGPNPSKILSQKLLSLHHNAFLKLFMFSHILEVVLQEIMSVR